MPGVRNQEPAVIPSTPSSPQSSRNKGWRCLPRLMRARFAGVTVIQGDAFRLAVALGGARFAAFVSSLPLLNFPLAKRGALIEDALSRLAPGAPFIQFSYGFAPPVAPPDGAYVKLAVRVWRNLPPARVWVYRR